jgi:hypothetical protein
MPTLPLRATKLPDPAGPRMDIISRGFEMLPNTAPFDVTGHPAITLPCGMSEGLPAGLMLIGKHWNESTIYKAADAYEKSHDWKKVMAKSKVSGAKREGHHVALWTSHAYGAATCSRSCTPRSPPCAARSVEVN